MKAKLLFIILLFCTGASPLLAQVPAPDSLARDTVPGPPDTLLLPGGRLITTDSLTLIDTIPQPSDTSGQFALPNVPDTDSIPPAADTTSNRFAQITFSQDSLDAPVDYTATDSMIYDIADQKIHLYGDAVVNYQTITLKAAHIVFDWKTNIVTAEGMPDSLGRPAGLPEFADGDQSFTAGRMRYNFQTRQGIVYDVTTEYTGIIVRGEKSKFISGEEPQDTSQQANDIIYSSSAIFTTCTDPQPHFGIRSNKQKVVTDKLVVVGPSNLEIMKIPTPLWLPFGFFPISKGRQTGLLFPRDYEYSPQWGFGIRDIGWYFPLGDNFNLSLKGNIYIKGTWGISAESQYLKRYKYSGNFVTGYDVRRSEDAEGNIDRPKSFQLRWTHNQAASAHPSIRFGGSINFQTNNYQSRVYNDARSVLDNQLNSNFSFSKNWLGKPISMSLSFNHSQNTRTQQITMSFPNLQFQTQTIYPFKRNKPGGKNKWYEDINFRYRADAKNTLTAPDSTFFTSETLKNARYGVKHEASTGTSFRVLKYFNLNPNVNYQEVWYFKSQRKLFIPGIVADTIIDPATGEEIINIDSFGRVLDTLVTGFQPFRTFSAGASLTTQIFGTLRFGKGPLRGLRHVIKPSLSFNYSPNYLDNEKYYRLVRSPVDEDEFERYSIFENGIYGAPPSSGQQMAIGYSLNNIFEAKYYSKKDSTEKKLKLFDNIVVSGNYNFVADSLKWSRIGISGTTRFFKGMTTVSLRGELDPHDRVYDRNNRPIRIDRTVWDSKRRPFDFVGGNASINTNLTVAKIRSIFQGQEEEVVEDLREEEEELPQRPVETDFLSLFENFRIAHNLALRWDKLPDGRDTFIIAAHSINLQGSIALTNNWNIQISGIGYDLVRKSLTYPSLGFTRDLHCWELGMQWAPTRGTYSFYIRVKPGPLDFLKIPYDQNNADGRRAFQ